MAIISSTLSLSLLYALSANTPPCDVINSQIHLISRFWLKISSCPKRHLIKLQVYQHEVLLDGSKNNITDKEWVGDLIIKGLPGQPPVIFQQYAGYITVDEVNGRSLFYYFVEAQVTNPTSKPVILWLNGGPGCSSVGNGAFTENGPFGVQKDGRTLYSRSYSWNKVANLLFLESPAGVGFSYSNTTSDYHATGDSRTAQESYTFLRKWFSRFPQYKNNDFHITGESYAGYYAPELAYLVVQNNIHAPSSSTIQLKGVMMTNRGCSRSWIGCLTGKVLIGNGLMNFETDIRGIYDYYFSHALISKKTHQGLLRTCFEFKSLDCSEFKTKAAREVGNRYIYDLQSKDCLPNSTIEDKRHGGYDSCEKTYVSAYMNLPQVQKALHANTTRLPYPWGLCSFVLHWGDSPSTMFTIYRRLFDARIHVLLYSGDMDATIPMTSTEYSIKALNLTKRSDRKPWFDDTQQVAGYREEYEGLTFMTVIEAGHEVPRVQPRKAFSMLKFYLKIFLV